MSTLTPQKSNPVLCLGRAQTVTTIGIVMIFAAFPAIPRDLVIASTAVMAIFTTIGWLCRWVVAFPLGVFCVVSMFGASLGWFSQVIFSLGMIVYIIAQTHVMRTGNQLAWLTRGTLTREVAWLAGGSILLSAIVLILWFGMVHPDITDLIQSFVPNWHWMLLIPAGFAFSMWNAAVEEVVYRGVVMHALERTVGAGIASLFGQAIAFGVLHVHGFPRGLSGVGLAMIFGILMGVIRRQSGGLLVPWGAHVCADVVIVSIVLLLGRA